MKEGADDYLLKPFDIERRLSQPSPRPSTKTTCEPKLENYRLHLEGNGFPCAHKKCKAALLNLEHSHSATPRSAG